MDQVTFTAEEELELSRIDGLPRVTDKPIWLSVQEDLGINLGSLFEKI